MIFLRDSKRGRWLFKVVWKKMMVVNNNNKISLSMLQKWFVIQHKILARETLEPFASSAWVWPCLPVWLFLWSCLLLPISFVPEISVLDKPSSYWLTEAAPFHRGWSWRQMKKYKRHGLLLARSILPQSEWGLVLICT